MSHLGRLLVATPLIADPNFERTVVLLLTHDDDGAFGVVLNRPTDVPAGEVVAAWAGEVAAPGVLFVGGPVGPQGVVGLARRAASPDAERRFSPIVGDLGTVDLHQDPEPGDGWGGVRLFGGSAGWAPGQLEDEILEGAWWTVDAAADDVLTHDPDGLWARVLRRQPGAAGWFANHPLDPSAN